MDREPAAVHIIRFFTEQNELPRSKLRGIEGCNLYI